MLKNVDSLALVEQYLKPIRARQKVAEESASHMETQSITEDEKPQSDETSVNQRNLGLEQTQAAVDGGSTVNSVAPNKDEDGKKPYDNIGPNTLTTDEPLVSHSEVLGQVNKHEIGQQDKMARAERLGNALLKAAGLSFESHQPLVKEATSDNVFEKCAEIAARAASEYYESYLLGMLKRAQDEVEVEKAGLDPALLDKVAMEDPAAVLPEGALESLGVAPEALAPEVAPEVAPEEGGVNETDVEELAAALDEAGVTPEDLEQAFSDVQALQEAGVSPEELTQALEEVGSETEQAASDVEAPPELMGEEGKVASDQERRERVEAVKEFLRAK
jgi:hypothetical protein